MRQVLILFIAVVVGLFFVANEKRTLKSSSSATPNELSSKLDLKSSRYIYTDYPTPVISLQQLVSIHSGESTTEFEEMASARNATEVDLTELRTRLNILVTINKNK